MNYVCPTTWQRRGSGCSPADHITVASPQFAVPALLAAAPWHIALPALPLMPSEQRQAGISLDTQVDILTVRRRAASFQLPVRDQLIRPHLPNIDAFSHIENLLHDLQAISVWIQQQTALALEPQQQTNTHAHTSSYYAR